MKDARLELRLTTEERAELIAMAVADGKTVSQMVRDKFFGGERRQQAGAAAGSGLPERATPPKPSKVRKCSHGIEAGYHCWQCHGRAIVVS